MPAALKRLARPVRTRAGEHPPLLPWLLRTSTQEGEQLTIGADTALVIEGFPRSGNSFASAAFGLVTQYAVPRVSNTHFPAQVRLAVSRALPTLVVIRRAGDAVASLCVAADYLRPAAGLREWLRFYRYVEPHRNGFVLATFDEVTSDFGAVLQRVNARFGTEFPDFVHTEAAAAEVFDSLETYSLRKDGAIREQAIARPSDVRRQRNQAVRAAMTNGRCKTLLAEADDVYDRLVRESS
jgi:hypothetical protein